MVPCAIAAGICACQVSPSALVSGRLTNAAVPCARACRTATATGESLWIRMRMVNGLPSAGGSVGRMYWMAGGSDVLAGAGALRARLGSAFGAGASELATVLPGAALPPTAYALLEEPQVAGPFPSRSLASIQYSLSGPPGKLTRKVSSRSLLIIGEASAFPPGARWWQTDARLDLDLAASGGRLHVGDLRRFGVVGARDGGRAERGESRENRGAHSRRLPQVGPGSTRRGKPRPQAAAVAPCCDSFTETIFEIPGSSMVTP